MNRRHFLGASIAATLAARFSLAKGLPEATHRIARPGLQLYTIRKFMPVDFDGSLAHVAKIGYKEVEFAGYFDHSPKDIRAVLDKNGLTAPSCHISLDIVQNKLPEAIEAAHVIGHQYIVCPWIDEKLRNQPDTWKMVADTFNKAGETTAKAGIQFCYHNHNFEFGHYASLGGQMPYDFLLQKTDPKLVKMEMDLCWTEVGGQDPVAYFKKWPGRFPLVHVKDMARLPKPPLNPDGTAVSLDSVKGDMVDVGKGVIDFKKIFAHADEGGIKHYFVEDDYTQDPWETLETSYKYISELRF